MLAGWDGRPRAARKPGQLRKWGSLRGASSTFLPRPGEAPWSAETAGVWSPDQEGGGLCEGEAGELVGGFAGVTAVSVTAECARGRVRRHARPGDAGGMTLGQAGEGLCVSGL